MSRGTKTRDTGRCKTMTLHDDNKRQRMEVLRIMADQQWRTLPQLSSALGNRYMTTSLSARLRDFRKEQFGSY